MNTKRMGVFPLSEVNNFIVEKLYQHVYVFIQCVLTHSSQHHHGCGKKIGRGLGWGEGGGWSKRGELIYNDDMIINALFISDMRFSGKHCMLIKSCFFIFIFILICLFHCFFSFQSILIKKSKTSK